MRSADLEQPTPGLGPRVVPPEVTEHRIEKVRAGIWRGSDGRLFTAPTGCRPEPYAPEFEKR